MRLKMKYLTGTTVMKMHIKNLSKIEIPELGLKEQEEIVKRLENLERTIVLLKNELELRRTQLEFYREKIFNGEMI